MKGKKRDDIINRDEIFFRKNKKILFTTIIFVLVLATLLIFVRNKQLLNSNANDPSRLCNKIQTERLCKMVASKGELPCRWESGKCVGDSSSAGTLSVTIKGAVALENTDYLNQNRFTKETCPGKPFKTDAGINVSSSDLGNAGWDCINPDFFFSQSQISKGVRTFTLTPPAGYKCVRSGYYLNDRSVIDYQTGCSLNVNISRGGNYYIWFRVQ